MQKLKEDLKIRIEHGENFLLKMVGEIGDMAKLIRNLIARIDKLEKRINKLEILRRN